MDPPLETGRIDHLVMRVRVLALENCFEPPGNARGIGEETVGISMNGVVAHVLPGSESRRTADEKDAERPLGLLAADRTVREKTKFIEDRIGVRRARLDGTCPERVVRDVLKDRVSGKDPVIAVLKPQIAVPFGHNHDV